MSERAKRKWERRSGTFKERVLERMKRGENVSALAKELGIQRSVLYLWKGKAERRRQGMGPEAIEDPRDGRIRELEQKVGELEGMIGQKTVELDFFAGALRRIEEKRQQRSSSGETVSTRKSASGCHRKAD